MAKQQIRNSKKSAKNSKKGVEWSFPLVRKDFIWLAIGIGVIALGYILMATGMTDEPAVADGKWNNVFAVNIAPILLVLGYCVIIPLAIFKAFTLGIRKKKDADQN